MAMTPLEQAAYTKGFNSGKDRNSAKFKEAEAIVHAFDHGLRCLDRQIKEMILLTFVEQKGFTGVSCGDVLEIVNEISGNCFNMINKFVEQRNNSNVVD